MTEPTIHDEHIPETVFDAKNTRLMVVGPYGEEVISLLRMNQDGTWTEVIHDLGLFVVEGASTMARSAWVAENLMVKMAASYIEIARELRGKRHT